MAEVLVSCGQTLKNRQVSSDWCQAHLQGSPLLEAYLRPGTGGFLGWEDCCVRCQGKAGFISP